MNLPNPIECTGYFWLPSDPNTRLPGTIRISRSGYCELHLTRLFEHTPLFLAGPTFGAPFHSKLSLEHKRIVGIVRFHKSSQPLTLLNCFYSTYNTPGQAGIATSIVVAKTALIGAMYEDDEQISLSEYRFSFAELDEWLQIFDSNITRESVDGRAIQGVTIKYTPPETKNYRLSNGMNIEINFDLSIPIRFGSAESKIAQKSFISIKSDTVLPLEAFFSMARKMQSFFCFCIDTGVAFDSSVGYSIELTQDSGDNQTLETPIYAYYQSTLRTEIEDVISPHEMLLTFRDIESQFEDTINLWIDQQMECEPALNLYFYTKYGARIPSNEDVFLSLSQSLESLHRSKFPNATMPDEEYKALVNSMLDVLPKERRQFFEGKLQFGNEPSFFRRINELFAPFAELFTITENPKRFIRRVVDTRNYHTHLAKELKSKSASGAQLIYLHRNLEALLQLHLLRLIGMNSETVEMISKRNYRLTQNLVVSNSE